MIWNTLYKAERSIFYTTHVTTSPIYLKVLIYNYFNNVSFYKRKIFLLDLDPEEQSSVRKFAIILKKISMKIVTL